MPLEANKALVHRMMEAIGAGNVRDVDGIFAPNWINHDPSLPPMTGRDGARQLINLFSSAFSSMHLEVEDIVAEGDKVAGRWRFGGTNTGAFQGMAPTGRSVSITATGIFASRTAGWPRIGSISTH